jgi:hypothetical protein
MRALKSHPKVDGINVGNQVGGASFFKINLDFIPSTFSLVCMYVIKNKLHLILVKVIGSDLR